MLETVREFATLKLNESKESEQIAIRHSEYFLQYVAGSVPKGWTYDASSMMEKIEIDFQNISKAFNYSIQTRDYKTTWTFIGVLMPLWFYRGHINESLAWIESAGMTIPLVMEKADSGDVNLNLCGTALLSTGVLYYYAGRYIVSHEFLTASRNLLERTEDKENLAWSLMYISLNGLSLEDLGSVSNFQHAIEIGKECEDKMPYMISQAFYTEVLLAQGMTEEALQLINEVEQLANTTGYDLVKAIVCFQKSNLLYFMGDYIQARDGYQQAINIFNKVNFLATMGWACGLYGSCLTIQQQYEEAHQQLLTSLTKGREAGDKEMILFALSLIAANHAAIGENVKAVQIMRSVSQFININQHYNAWSTSKKSLQVISQIFEQAGLMPELIDQAAKAISLEEAITLAFA
jgi:tetratricopeptide (TPR) repeat protein